MVNKLLIGFGVVVLVAVGSVGAWKLSGSDRRAGALGPIDEPIPLTWRGEWAKDAKYDAGQVVTYEQSSYVAEAATSGEIPNAKDGQWALMAAQGSQGAAGAFNGTFQSPNGSYSLVVADDGIVLSGPPGSIKLRSTGVEVIAANNVSVNAGQGVTLQGANGAVIKSNAGLDVIADRNVTFSAGQSLNFLGASGTLLKSNAGMTVQAQQAMTVLAGTSATVQAGGTLYLKGSKIQQN
jgi:hypothetical protein